MNHTDSVHEFNSLSDLLAVNNFSILRSFSTQSYSVCKYTVLYISHMFFFFIYGYFCDIFKILKTPVIIVISRKRMTSTLISKCFHEIKKTTQIMTCIDFYSIIEFLNCNEVLKLPVYKLNAWCSARFIHLYMLVVLCSF